MQMGRSFDVNVDPLAQITAPPVNETPEQRRAREHEEANARKVSEQIDEALKAEREEGKAKRKNRLKVLLLGQSESGTSGFLFPSYHYPRSSMRRRCFSLYLLRLPLREFQILRSDCSRCNPLAPISISFPPSISAAFASLPPMPPIIFLIG